MKRVTSILVIFITIFSFAQEQRKVLVEVFTNSHCPLCPAAHNVIDNYLAGPNSGRISYIYYHMVYPYSDDLLYHQSIEGSDARDNYYNPIQATPRGFFDGEIQGSNSGWAATLDALVATESPLKIILSGTRSENQFNIIAELTRTGNITDEDLVLHFVVVEDLYYAGRNGIADHKQVMRKMLPTPTGLPFAINLNETKYLDQLINIDPSWDADSLKIVVFVQSISSMTVHQSETISNGELTVTAVENEDITPTEFSLEQNYPNPFNPSTKIRFSIPETSYTSLKVFNVLGNEVATLISNDLSAGIYDIDFSATNLSSGAYFYTLTLGNFRETKKLILMK